MVKNNARKQQQQQPVEKAPGALRQTMAKPIADYTVPDDLRTLMANARRLGRDDVWRDAFRRLCVLEGAGQADPLDRDFYEMLAAYEHFLSERNGRATRATPTRLKARTKGVVHVLEEWVTGKAPTDAYELLVARGMPELTGEQLVLKHSERFSAEAVAAAKARVEPVPAG